MLSDYVTGVTRIWKEDRIQKTYKSCPFKRSLRNQDVDRMHRKMDETIANSWSTSAYVHIYLSNCKSQRRFVPPMKHGNMIIREGKPECGNYFDSHSTN